MNKLKIGVLGAYRGMTMIDVLLNHPEAELVAVCDKYEPLLDDVRKKAEDKNVSVALYNHFDDFITHDMDAVVLANYAHQHVFMPADTSCRRSFPAPPSPRESS